MTIGERLKTVRGKLTRDDLAAKLGVHKNTLASYELGKSFPGSDVLNNIMKLFPDVNPAWLLSGEGQMKRTGGFPAEIIEVGPKTDSNTAESGLLYNSKHIELKVFALAGAGHPNSLVDTEPVAEIVVPKDFYKPSIVPVKIRGRSMEDTIMDGAIVGVDRTDKRVVSGEIFAVWMPYEGAVVKRLYLDTEKITCRSDNPKFDDFIVSLDKVGEHFIQGRIKWVIQQY